MKVPDELVEEAMDVGGWSETDEAIDRMRISLEAVLPKVRERLLSDEAMSAFRRVINADPEGDYAAIEAAFDHAFPEEEP